MISKSLLNNKHLIYGAFFIFYALLFCVEPSFSAGTGGLNKLESQAIEWDKAIYAFIGAGAAIYLLFVGVQVWGTRKTWIDLGEAALKVAIVGGIPAITVFAWNFFTS